MDDRIELAEMTLIERLRKYRFYLNTAYQDQWQISEDMRDAADALEQAQAEIERLRSEHNEYRKTLKALDADKQERLQARIEKLEVVKKAAAADRQDLARWFINLDMAVAAAEDE